MFDIQSFPRVFNGVKNIYIILLFQFSTQFEINNSVFDSNHLNNVALNEGIFEAFRKLFCTTLCCTNLKGIHQMVYVIPQIFHSTETSELLGDLIWLLYLHILTFQSLRTSVLFTLHIFLSPLIFQDVFLIIWLFRGFVVLIVPIR